MSVQTNSATMYSKAKRYIVKSGSAGSITAKALMYLLPGIYAITCIFPIIWLFYTSFKTQTEFSVNVLALPKKLNIANYEYVFTKLNIGRYMFNTVRITFFVLMLVLLFSFINGYFISRFRFKLRNVLYGTYMASLFIPIQAILVPTYILVVKMGLHDKWFSTILPIVCLELTTSTFLVQGYISTIPIEMEEAAAIDGSSFTRTLFTIIFPTVKPILVTIGIITFFHSWNEFTYSLIIFQSEINYTVPLALMRFKGDYFTDYPRIMTTIFVCMIPALILYFAFSQQIIKGMMAGAVKG